MQARFNHLYKVKRLRIDDATAQVADEFFMSKAMTEKIILYYDDDDGEQDEKK